MPRKKDRDLPPGMYRKNGAFWLVLQNRWIRLAALDDPTTAFAKYADIKSGGKGRKLRDAINRFMADHIPNLKPGSKLDYQRACIFLIDWADELELDQVKSRHIARLLDEYPSPGRANKIVGVLSSIYSRSIRWGWTDTNPCAGVPRNKRKRITALPTWKEIRKLKSTLPDRRQAAMDLALITALRLGDMLALRRSDCADDGLRANISKTDSVIVYEWTDELREVIQRLRHGAIGSVWLLPNNQGQRYTVSGWESMWQRDKKKAGLQHIRWHDLRARSLTDAKQKHGRDYAQALAGHADGSTTERYIRDRSETVIQSKFLDNR